MTEIDWTYVAFDPGGTTGIACWDATCHNGDGQPVFIDQANEAELDEFLEVKLPGKGTKKFIYEGYKNRPDKMSIHMWSDNPTSQVIGQIKAYARRKKIELIEQPSSILTIAQLQSGVKLSKTHSKTHWQSAYCHGFYHLNQQGLIRSRLLREE